MPVVLGKKGQEVHCSFSTGSRQSRCKINSEVLLHICGFCSMTVGWLVTKLKRLNSPSSKQLHTSTVIKLG